MWIISWHFIFSLSFFVVIAVSFYVSFMYVDYIHLRIREKDAFKNVTYTHTSTEWAHVCTNRVQTKSNIKKQIATTGEERNIYLYIQKEIVSETIKGTKAYETTTATATTALAASVPIQMLRRMAYKVEWIITLRCEIHMFIIHLHTYYNRAEWQNYVCKRCWKY